MLLLILPFLCQIDILALYSCWYSYFPYDQAIAPLLYSLSLQLFLVSSMCMINELVTLYGRCMTVLYLVSICSIWFSIKFGFSYLVLYLLAPGYSFKAQICPLLHMESSVC